MSVLRALLDAATPQELEALAERLRPLLVSEPKPDAWLRGADAIAAHLGCSRSRVYSLVSAGRIPVQKDGAAVVALRGDLDAWVKRGGARCP